MSSSDPPFLTVLGITAEAATGAAGLTASLAVYHHFSSKFIYDLKWVAQAIITLLSQVDSPQFDSTDQHNYAELILHLTTLLKVFLSDVEVSQWHF